MDNRAMEIQSEIAGLKQILAATDYKALKHADGALSDEITQKQRYSVRSLETKSMSLKQNWQ